MTARLNFGSAALITRLARRTAARSASPSFRSRRTGLTLREPAAFARALAAARFTSAATMEPTARDVTRCLAATVPTAPQPRRRTRSVGFADMVSNRSYGGGRCYLTTRDKEHIRGCGGGVRSVL